MYKLQSSFCFLILHMSLRIVWCASFGSPDCDPRTMVDNMMRLCGGYDGFQNNYLKREIGDKNTPVFRGFGKEAFYQYLQQAMETQSVREYPYPWQTPPRTNRPLPPPTPYLSPWQNPTKRTNPLSDAPPAPPFREYQPNKNNEDLLPPGNDFLNPVNYMEPQDFETFNYWYLNPVYSESDVDFKGRNKRRWKRYTYKDFLRWLGNHFSAKVVSELWDFFRLKCCGDGCPYPSDFAQLDARINYCG